MTYGATNNNLKYKELADSLKGCPSCGSEDIGLLEKQIEYQSPSSEWVECLGCGLRTGCSGPDESMYDLAVKWNTRAEVS